jgi:DNA-binding transcriptional regulator YiaG
MISKGRGRGFRWQLGHINSNPFPLGHDYWKRGLAKRRKFSPEQIKDIRKRRKQGVRQVDLMAEFGVTKRTIRMIITRETYR